MKKDFCYKLQNLVNDLLKDHSVESVRKVLILFWIRNNRIDNDLIKHTKTTKEFVEKSPTKDQAEILKILEDNIETINIKALEGAFEVLIDKKRKKHQGVVYTPDNIVEYLVEYLVDAGLMIAKLNKSSFPKICDPSCGSGGFLVKASEILKMKFNIDYLAAFNHCIFGIDIDPIAVNHAKCLIELFLISKGLEKEHLEKLEIKVYCLDALLTAPNNILELLGCNDGFDLVTTNPPYVKLQNLELSYRDKLLNKYVGFTKGSFSLAILFILAGYKLLRDGGSLSFITQNNLFTTLAGEPIREFLQLEKAVSRVIDFGSQHLFKNASAYTCLLFLNKRCNKEIEYALMKETPSKVSLNKATYDLIKYDELNCKKWRLAPRRHLDNIKKIEEIGRPLGVITQIRVGFATLKDKIYFVQTKNGSCIAVNNGNGGCQIEKKITVPAVKIADFNNEEELSANMTRIIFPYKKHNGRYFPLEESLLRGEFPKTYDYLTYNKNKLLERQRERNRIDPWFAWGRSQSMEAPGPKLLTKTFSSKPNFMLDESDQLFCNGYAIFEKTEKLFLEDFGLREIQKILNSKVMHYYAKLTSFQLEGDYQCYQKNFIEKFGIPSFSKSDVRLLKKISSEGEINEFLFKCYRLSKEDVNEVLC